MDFPFIKEALSQLFSKPSCEMYVPDKTKEGAPNYRGRIVFHPDKCINCMMCERVCSGNAITHVIEKTPEGDDKVTRTFYLGSCTFCATCMDFCGHGAIEFTRDYHMIATKEEDLMVSGTFIKKAPVKKAPAAKPAAPQPAAAPAPAEGGRVIKPRDDGKPVQVPSKCVYCTICAKKCPAGALEVDRANKTWKLDEDNCVGCGTCAEACPKKAILMPGDEPVTEAAPAAAAPAPKAEEKAAPTGAMISPRDDGKPVQVPGQQDLEAGRGQLRGLRHLCRGLPQEGHPDARRRARSRGRARGCPGTQGRGPCTRSRAQEGRARPRPQGGGEARGAAQARGAPG